jgi:hypothetical protein
LRITKGQKGDFEEGYPGSLFYLFVIPLLTLSLDDVREDLAGRKIHLVVAGSGILTGLTANQGINLPELLVKNFAGEKLISPF